MSRVGLLRTGQPSHDLKMSTTVLYDGREQQRAKQVQRPWAGVFWGWRDRKQHNRWTEQERSLSDHIKRSSSKEKAIRCFFCFKLLKQIQMVNSLITLDK